MSLLLQLKTGVTRQITITDSVASGSNACAESSKMSQI